MNDNPAPASKHEALREWIAEMNPEALMADGFEDAILGVAERCSKDALVVYDAQKCIEILMTRDGMTDEEAQEFFEFNTLGAWAGENTPLYLWRKPPADELEAMSNELESSSPDDEYPPDDFPREVGP